MATSVHTPTDTDTAEKKKRWKYYSRILSSNESLLNSLTKKKDTCNIKNKRSEIFIEYYLKYYRYSLWMKDILRIKDIIYILIVDKRQIILSINTA